jgi:hypothetical protein
MMLIGAPRASRPSIWLVASLAANLLLIGIVLAWISGIGTPPPRRSPIDWQRAVIGSLSPEDARIVSATLERFDARQSANDDQMRANYPKLHSVIVTAPLDVQALQQAMDDGEKMRAERHAATERDFLDELTQLSPDGRTKLLAAFDQELQRWRFSPH